MSHSFLILIAEHSAMPINRFAHAVLRYEHRIIHASHGQSCLQFAETGNPDVILLDANLPDISGLQVIKELHQRKMLERIPLIVMADHQSESELAKSAHKDSFATIKKPYRMQHLEDLIVQAMARRVALQKKPSRPNQHWIDVRKDDYRYVFQFHDGWSENIARESKRILTRQLAQEIVKYQIILDLRSLTELTDRETSLLEKLVHVLHSDQIFILAGRHFGVLLTAADLEERTKIFISTDELANYIKLNKQIAAG